LSGKLQDANRRPAGAADTRANTSGSDRFGLVLFAFCHRIAPPAVPLKSILTPFPHAGARNGLTGTGPCEFPLDRRRICFVRANGYATGVETVDYH
jgi:hypothetical protein